MKKFRKTLAWVLSLAMVITMIPVFTVMSSADTSVVDFTDVMVDANHVVYTAMKTAEATPVVSGSTGWGSADTTTWLAVTSDIDTTNRYTCTGDVRLILCDGKTLKCGGITVSGEGNSLTIYDQSAGSGKLVATGAENQAGIGGAESDACSYVTINGGVIEATGGTAAAGIGGGSNSSAEKTITVNRGKVTATGTAGEGTCGTGIGGGNFGGASDITINGGEVTATGSFSGNRSSAGIGCTGMYSAYVNIYGGKINATGGGGEYPGRGIGYGFEGGGDRGFSTITYGESITAEDSDYVIMQGQTSADTQVEIEDIEIISGSTDRFFTMDGHSHVWNLTAEDGVITAACTAANGTCPASVSPALTLNAPARSTQGGDASEEATITLSSGWASNELVMPKGGIKYYNQGEDTPLGAAPAADGPYTAKMTIGNDFISASLDYTIGEGSPGGGDDEDNNDSVNGGGLGILAFGILLKTLKVWFAPLWKLFFPIFRIF